MASGLNRHLYSRQLTKHQTCLATSGPVLPLKGLPWHMLSTDSPGDPDEMSICTQTVPRRAGEQPGSSFRACRAEDNGLLFVQFPCPSAPPTARWQVTLGPCPLPEMWWVSERWCCVGCRPCDRAFGAEMRGHFHPGPFYQFHLLLYFRHLTVVVSPQSGERSSRGHISGTETEPQ